MTEACMTWDSESGASGSDRASEVDQGQQDHRYDHGRDSARG